jgi:hypothetical protein
MSKKPSKLPPKASKNGPKPVKKPSDEPKVTYVYRKDAFNKVKLA